MTHNLTQREQLLRALAGRVLETPSPFVLRVAIDGVDGAGKTTFADELAFILAESGRAVIRASVDGFHHSQNIRHRLGRGSPEGFYRDSYDYDALKTCLLEPLSPGGSGRYRTAVYDVEAETPVTVPEQVARAGSVLLFDGIFLHRSELLTVWDLSVWLEVPFSVSVPRGAGRGPGYGSPDPEAGSNRRYVEGQKLYLSECRPQARATFVVDNSDLSAPRLERP